MSSLGHLQRLSFYRLFDGQLAKIPSVRQTDGTFVYVAVDGIRSLSKNEETAAHALELQSQVTVDSDGSAAPARFLARLCQGIDSRARHSANQTKINSFPAFASDASSSSRAQQQAAASSSRPPCRGKRKRRARHGRCWMRRRRGSGRQVRRRWVAEAHRRRIPSPANTSGQFAAAPRSTGALFPAAPASTRGRFAAVTDARHHLDTSGVLA